MNESGKISVLMGLYNCAETLPAALDSILSQTYQNWEMILCDDGSTDDTAAVAREYAARFPDRIVLLQNDCNRHLAYSLNRCLEAATGEFVARMDGDDVSLPDRFAKQMAFLKEHPEVVLCGTAMQRVNDDGERGLILRCPARPDRQTPRRSNVFNHATVLGYTHVFRALGGYTVLPRTERGQDLDLWFRFLHAGYTGANLPEVLYLVRETPRSIKRRTAKNRRMVYQTTLQGYRLLGYPLRWYIRPTLMLAKCLVPAWGVRWYQRWQTKRQQRKG